MSEDEVVSIAKKRWWQFICPHWFDEGYELSHPLWEGSARVCRICKKTQWYVDRPGQKWKTINVERVPE